MKLALVRVCVFYVYMTIHGYVCLMRCILEHDSVGYGVQAVDCLLMCVYILVRKNVHVSVNMYEYIYIV